MNDSDVFLWIVIAAVIVVHIAFGIVSARVASGKGRSPDLGFLAGFLLNSIGLIIVMLMCPSIEAEAQRRIEVEQEYERQRRSGPSRTGSATDTEQEFGQQRRPGPDPTAHATGTQDRQRATLSVQRARYGDVVDLPVVVLSTPDQRARGLSILASEAVTGVLYFWPEGGTHEVRFLNPYSRIEMRVAIVDTASTIEDILILGASDDPAIEPINPVGSAIAFRAKRFESLEIDIGDKVVLPDDLRP